MFKRVFSYLLDRTKQKHQRLKRLQYRELMCLATAMGQGTEGKQNKLRQGSKHGNYKIKRKGKPKILSLSSKSEF